MVSGDAHQSLPLARRTVSDWKDRRVRHGLVEDRSARSEEPSLISSQVGRAAFWPVDETRKLPEHKATFFAALVGLLIPLFCSVALAQITWSATNMPMVVETSVSSRTFLIASIAALLVVQLLYARSRPQRAIIASSVFGIAIMIGACGDYLEDLRTLRPASPAILVIDGVSTPQFARRGGGPIFPTMHAHTLDGSRIEVVGREAYLSKLRRGDCLRGRYFVGRNGLVVLRDAFPIDCTLAEQLAADW